MQDTINKFTLGRINARKKISGYQKLIAGPHHCYQKLSCFIWQGQSSDVPLMAVMIIIGTAV